MAAPQVAGAAALLLAAYAAGGANVTGRGLEVKALLLATVQRVPGMAHKVRGCSVTQTLTPTGRGLEVKALLLATVQRVPGMAHKVRGCSVALEPNPATRGPRVASVAQAPGSGSAPGRPPLRRRGARQSRPCTCRCCCAWLRLGEGGWLTTYIPETRSLHGGCDSASSLSVARGPELSAAGQMASGGRLDAGRASIPICGARVGAGVEAKLKMSCARQVASGGRLDVGRAMAALPADLSVFRGNPNAPLPYDAGRAAAVPAFDPAVDPAVLDYQPTNPGAPRSAAGVRGRWAHGARERVLGIARTWWLRTGRLWVRAALRHARRSGALSCVAVHLRGSFAGSYVPKACELGHRHMLICTRCAVPMHITWSAWLAQQAGGGIRLCRQGWGRPDLPCREGA